MIPGDPAYAKALGQRLRWARKLVQPNRAEFAQAIGIDWSTLRKFETGDRLPSITMLLALCSYLRISTSYLLHGSLDGVDGELALLLTDRHPELHATRAGTVPHPLRKGGGSRRNRYATRPAEAGAG